MASIHGRNDINISEKVKNLLKAKNIKSLTKSKKFVKK